LAGTICYKGCDHRESKRLLVSSSNTNPANQVRGTESIGLVLLAAGGSSRLGEPKQLLLYQGRTLLRRAAETACASVCNPVIVVLGRDADRMTDELYGLDVSILVHSAWQKGIGTSIAAAFSELPTVSAAVILLCDQVAVTTSDLNLLVEAFQRRSAGQSIVTSTFDGQRGPPVLFDRSHFEELRKLQGDTGARRVIQQYRHDVIEISLPHAAVDVDTPEDYRCLLDS
jgi:molybdenum cofactor cytidylyltransferase